LELYLILASSFAVSSYFTLVSKARSSAIEIVDAKKDSIVYQIASFVLWFATASVIFPLLLVLSLVDHDTLYDKLEEAQVELLVEKGEDD